MYETPASHPIEGLHEGTKMFEETSILSFLRATLCVGGFVAPLQFFIYLPPYQKPRIQAWACSFSSNSAGSGAAPAAAVLASAW